MVRLWGPVILWMALIFAGSTDLLSSRRTSRIIGPLLRFFAPSVTDETIRHVQIVVRKTGHLAEYAILAALAHRGFSGLRNRPVGMWTAGWQAWLLCSAYAATDEIHQSFVSSRQGSPWDWLIDSIGAFVGLCVVQRRARLKAEKQPPASDAPIRKDG